MSNDAASMSLAEKLRVTCQLHDLGVSIMRQNLHRRHPQAQPEEIDARLHQWLRTRPGAELGDVSGPGIRSRSCE